MQSVSRQIEIARLVSGIQVCQDEGDSVQLVGGNPAGVVSLIEPPPQVVSRFVCKLEKGRVLPVSIQVADDSEDYPFYAG